MQADFFHQKVMPLKNKLYRFACMLLNNTADAEDVLQETLLKLWLSRDNLNGIKNIEAWSMTIIKNMTYDRLRKRKRIDKVMLNSDQLELASEAVDNQVIRKESLDKIYSYIETLPDKQKQVIFLRDIEGYSYKEICDILEMDENNMKVILFRARASLRSKILKIDNYGI